jgi:opacity protein-like surface antigen
MRKFLAAAVILGLAGATAASAAVVPQGGSRIAVSADNLAVQALYRGPTLDVGYSAETRRMTACLATYPGAYDPRTDLVRFASGATRRCAL